MDSAKGYGVSYVAYYGNISNEANAKYMVLMYQKNKGKYTILGDGLREVNVQITGVNLLQTEDDLRMETIYKIEVKGVIL